MVFNIGCSFRRWVLLIIALVFPVKGGDKPRTRVRGSKLGGSVEVQGVLVEASLTVLPLGVRVFVDPQANEHHAGQLLKRIRVLAVKKFADVEI